MTEEIVEDEEDMVTVQRVQRKRRRTYQRGVYRGAEDCSLWLVEVVIILVVWWFRAVRQCWLSTRPVVFSPLILRLRLLV